MKKSFVVFVSSLLVALTVLINFPANAQNTSKARRNVAESQKKMDKANEDYLEDVRAYKKEMSKKIAANERKIAAFKKEIRNEDEDERAENQERIDDLEQKNRDMKKKMDDYKPEGRTQWQSFKKEFSHDMDGLGNAFKSFTIKNTK